MHLERYGVTGCLLFTQITREEILHKHKTITFDVVGERPATKYIQIS